jgi:hypothetical protein
MEARMDPPEVKTWHWKHTHKYRAELPKSVMQALAINTAMGTSFWKDAIEREMKDGLPVFKFW